MLTLINKHLGIFIIENLESIQVINKDFENLPDFLKLGQIE